MPQHVSPNLLKSDYESSVKKLTVLVSKKGKKNNKLAELLSTLSIYSVDPSLLDSLLAGILLIFLYFTILISLFNKALSKYEDKRVVRLLYYHIERIPELEKNSGATAKVYFPLFFYFLA